jgi:tetratricopeptide (TPR) repeat protein
MGTAVAMPVVRFRSYADSALKFAGRLWFGLAVAGQLTLAFEVASFYSHTAARGQWSAWNKFMLHGYVPGQPIGNGVVAAHLVGVVLLILSGALQLAPQVLRRAPKVHRWSGRVYMVAALAMSGAGVSMLVRRGTSGGPAEYAALFVNAALIWVFAGLALRYALKRDFVRHKQWALRLYVVSLGVFFLRVAVLMWVTLLGPVGMDFTTFTGPALAFWAYGCYLVPLAMMELYLRTQARPGSGQRWAMAGLLFVMTLLMGVGTAAAAAGTWVPTIERTYSSRLPISEVMETAIAANGIDAAVGKYRELKATAPGRYNFAEDELNDLGYRYIRVKNYPVAIKVLALNVETYPQSWNTWDSLGEAYRDGGDKRLALVNYRKSVELNPKSVGGLKAIEALSR